MKIIPSSSFTYVSLELVYKWIGKKIKIECMGKRKKNKETGNARVFKA